MEFENVKSVKASRRRRTPVWINASTWAFTFSTPASASTTGVVPQGAATRLASSTTVTLVLANRIIKLESSVLDESHDGRARKRLTNETDLKERAVRDWQRMVNVRHTERSCADGAVAQDA
jgi:hypothetical protein